MSELTGQAATGGQIGPAHTAAGGTPSESDLPNLQGLDDSVDDPSDPEAARGGDGTPGEAPIADLMDPGDSKGASDPMPDMSGSTGS